MSPATANAIAACYLPSGVIRSGTPGRESLAWAAYAALNPSRSWLAALPVVSVLGMTAEQRVVFGEAYRWAKGRDTRFAPAGFETW